MSLILDAARYAERAHRGQVRKYTGWPYITHCARVAGAVSCWHESDDIMVAVGWLHDTIEDCGISYQAIYEVFGIEVATLVKELTNPSKEFPEWPRHKRKAIDLQHIAGI